MTWELARTGDRDGELRLRIDGDPCIPHAAIPLVEQDGVWSVTVDGPHDIVPGAMSVKFAGGATLKVELGEGDKPVALVATGAMQIDIVICPLLRLLSDGAPDLRPVAWPFVVDNQQRLPGLHFQRSIQAGVRIELGAPSLIECLLPATSDVSLLGSARTSLFRRGLLRAAATALDLGDLTISGLSDRGSVSVGDAVGGPRLLLRHPKATLDVPGRTSVELDIEELVIDMRSLQLAGASFLARIIEERRYDVGDTLTVVFPAGTRCRFRPVLADPRVELESADGGPVLTAYIPGLAGSDPVVDGSDESRFIIDLKSGKNDKPGNDDKVSISHHGLTALAELRPTRLKVGTLECSVTGGSVRFQEGRYDAQITASARLPYFRHGEGNLLIRAGSEAGFAAQWEANLGRAWEDPTGHLLVHEPRATVTVGWSGGTWKVEGRLGGRLELTKAPRFLAGAERWLGTFARGLRFEFDQLDLSDLDSSDFSIKLDPKRLPQRLDLWGFFEFDLQQLELCRNGFVVGGDLRFERNGLSFSGSLPRLRCEFSTGGIGIRAGGGDDIEIRGHLKTRSGIEVRASFRRRQSGDVDEMIGAGTIAIASLPSISVLCAIGRRVDRNGSCDPVLLLYTEADIPVPLFPGVVLRELGLGFGINKVLAAVAGTRPEDLVTRLIDDPKGLPDAANPAAWSTPPDGFDLSLVAQTAIAPAPRGEGPFPYVGRATMYVQPTSECVLLLLSRLWLLTSLDDSRRSEFQRRPALKGALAIYPRHGYLELQVRTERKPAFSAPVPLLDQAFSIASGEFHLKASRDAFLCRAGPLRARVAISGLSLEGHVVHAVYVGRHGAITVLETGLQARAEASRRPAAGRPELRRRCGREGASRLGRSSRRALSPRSVRPAWSRAARRVSGRNRIGVGDAARACRRSK